MKKILSLTVGAILFVTLISGGSWAWLSDTETSADNSLSAYVGNLDLTIDGGNEVVTTFTETGIKPGDSGRGFSVLANEGSIPGLISITFSAVTNSGGDGGTEFEDGSGHLGTAAELAVYLDRDRDGAYGSGDIGLKADGTAYPYPHYYPTEFQYDAINDYASQTWNDLFEMAPDDDFDFIAMWRVPVGTGNDIEGDSVSFDAYFILNQLPEEPNIIIDGIVSESAWNEWFSDTHTDLGPFELHFTAYWYADEHDLYLAVKTLTDTTYNPGKRDVVQWYLDAGADGLDSEDRTFTLDTKFPYHPVSGMSTWTGWRWTLPFDLPPDVELEADDTGGYRSYEIRIPLAELGDPSQIKVQFTVEDYAHQPWGMGINSAVNDHPDLGDGFDWFDSTYWRDLSLP